MVRSQLFVYSLIKKAGDVSKRWDCSWTAYSIYQVVLLSWLNLGVWKEVAIKNLWQEQWDNNLFDRLYFNLSHSVLNSTVGHNKSGSETLFFRLHIEYFTLFILVTEKQDLGSSLSVWSSPNRWTGFLKLIDLKPCPFLIILAHFLYVIALKHARLIFIFNFYLSA